MQYIRLEMERSESLTMSMPMFKRLPNDLITEILRRLPAKSVGRFKCASKEWRSFLSSPQFVRSHINFNLRHPQHLLAFTMNSGCKLLTLNSSGIASSKVITCPLEKEDRFFNLGSSCDGLVIVSVGDGFIRFLMNPVTRESLRVRKWPIGCVTGMVHGLGYEAISNDYKIVNFSWGLGGIYVVDVYSVRMKRWRTLPSCPNGFKPHVPTRNNGMNESVFVNGCIHWLGTVNDPSLLFHPRGNRTVIYAFDLAREEFEEVLPPSSVKMRYCGQYEMKLLGGYLALMLSPFLYGSSVDVWLMKEYGVRDSWTKLTISSPKDSPINVRQYQVVSLFNEDEVVLRNDRHKDNFVAYNWRSGIWRDLSNGFTDLSVAKAVGESLVSPNYD